MDDAVIGRHILIHTKDALAVLKKAVEMVRISGLIAFQEYDLSWCPRGYPEMHLMFRVEEQIVEFFRRAAPRPNIGTQLFYLMQEAGLAPPECRADTYQYPAADVSEEEPFQLRAGTYSNENGK